MIPFPNKNTALYTLIRRGATRTSDASAMPPTTTLRAGMLGETKYKGSLYLCQKEESQKSLATL